VQRISKYGYIQNNILTPDEELNVLIYGTHTYVVAYRSYNVVKMVQHSGPLCNAIAMLFTKTERRKHANVFNKMRAKQINKCQ